MKIFHWVIAAIISAATAVQSISAAGAEADCAHVTRANLVSCALAASLAAEVDRYGIEAARGREEAARPFLPSNPVLSGWVARRTASGVGSDTNWSLNLSQEIAISGERGARLRSAAFGRSAKEQVLVATKRQAAVDAWHAYFDSLAAEEELRLVRRLSETAQRVTAASKAAPPRIEGSSPESMRTSPTPASSVSRIRESLRKGAHPVRGPSWRRCSGSAKRDPSMSRVRSSRWLCPRVPT